MNDTYDMTFLQSCASNRYHPLSVHEQEVRAMAGSVFRQADEVIIYLGGKAGRLGECVVGTALLEGTLQALTSIGKTGIPVTIGVDKAAMELFNEQLYQEKYWPQIIVKPATKSPQELIREGRSILVVDFHGAHDGMPHLHIEEEVERRVTTLGHLFRIGVRHYAQRGPQRRYADFIEELFILPVVTLDGSLVQPCLLLSAEDKAHYTLLVKSLDLDINSIQVICFFQSVVIAKCYELWDEVMLLFCDYLARYFPKRRIDFLVACGPDEQLPQGFKFVDMKVWFQNFTGVKNNARVLVHRISSLRDLAILAHRAMFALSNDTGPGHIAGALHTPTIIPYLPGTIYSMSIWSSTTWHHGVTLEPNPYSDHEVETAVLCDYTDIINSIAPRSLQDEILKCLPPDVVQ